MAGSAKPMTKSEIQARLAEACDLSKKQIDQVFTELANLIRESLQEGGPEVFTIPGLLKIKVVHKPATPEREGINPFTGEKTTFAAKPARNVVKVTPLKGLKDMV